jgi:hypothetical protein
MGCLIGTASLCNGSRLSMGFSILVVSGLLGFAANNMVCDHCLIGIHGYMLHRDLLLPTTSMLIQSLGQQRYRSRGFVSELQIFCSASK